MKKKDIVHPKLYFKYDIVDHEIQLSYYSNQLDDSGDRLVKIIFLNQDAFSYMEMYKLYGYVTCMCICMDVHAYVEVYVYIACMPIYIHA